MSSTTRRRWPLLAVLCVLVLGLVAAAAGNAAPVKPDFALGVNPVSQSVPRGQAASYTVTATAVDGFTGSVALSASGQPSGATVTFSPPSITLSSTSAGVTVTVTTSAGTPAGTYSITVSAVSGKLNHSIALGLTVNSPLSPAISLSATPAASTVPTGATAAYTVSIARTNAPGPVTLSLSGGLPAGATASFSPDPVTGSTSTLQVTTNANTPTGSYALAVVGAVTAGSTTQYAYAQVQLTVAAPSGKPFTISGNLAGTLAPGVAPQPLNLVLSNPNNQGLSISNLTVTVTGAGGSCGAGNFTVVQYTGPYPISLPANQTASLAQLGVPSSAWPRVGMLDLPTNQDACKGVSVQLAYSGAGQGA